MIGKSNYTQVFVTKGGILNDKRVGYGERLRIFEIDPEGIEFLDYSAYRMHPQWVTSQPIPVSNLKLLRKSRGRAYLSFVEDPECFNVYQVTVYPT